MKTKRLHKNREVSKVKKILDKPVMRRIGFDFPDLIISEFKTAVSINGTSMTATITEWMAAYCDEVKKESGLDRLTK